MAWTKEIELAAADGKPVPPGLTVAEKGLYQAMRGLYASYKAGLIELDQAKLEKRTLLNDFGQLELSMKAWERSMRAWRWVNLNLNDAGCPHCLEMKKTILQLENTM